MYKMKEKEFHKAAGAIFLVVGALHLVRAFLAWPMDVNSYKIAVWFSYIAGIVILWLAYQSFKLAKKGK